MRISRRVNTTVDRRVHWGERELGRIQVIPLELDVAIQVQTVLPCRHVTELGDVGRNLVPSDRNDAGTGLLTRESDIEIGDEEPVDTLRQPVNDISTGITIAAEAKRGHV